MISVSEAKEIIGKSIGPLAPKTFGLLQAATKVLAEDAWAKMDIPAFKQSSMDGYAIRFANKDLPLTIVGKMAAGSAQTLTVDEGKAARIDFQIQIGTRDGVQQPTIDHRFRK